MFAIKIKRVSIYFLFIITSLLFVFYSFFSFSIIDVFAQNSGPVIIMEPQNPGPNEEVFMRLEHIGSELDRAQITWSKNGVIQTRGLGIKTFSTQSGNLGQETRITVSLTTQDGDFFTQQVTLRPTTVDLLWEADTYTPPLYRGKALPSPQSTIKVVAFPTFITNSGTRIPSDQLFYKWLTSKSNSSLDSGQGKNSLVLESDLLNDETVVSVTVSSPGGSLVKEKSIIIKSQKPEIVLYEEDPLLGPQYQKALTSPFTLSGNEVTITAEPYNFSNWDVVFGGQYMWTLNNKGITPHSNSRSVTLVRGQSDVSGTQSLVIKIKNSFKIRQVAEKLLRISF